jgi:hypothetical protein
MDDLVKVLDREHVVLKIQRIPSDRCNAVGIELRKRRSKDRFAKGIKNKD